MDVDLSEPYVLHTTRTNDMTLALVGGLLGPLMLWGVFGVAWGAVPEDFEGTRGGWLPALIVEHLGWPVFAVLVGLLGWGLACLGAGAIWRLADRRPVAVLGQEGIAFHPSYRRQPLRWHQISKVEKSRFHRSRLQIRTHRRFWSLENCFATRSVGFYYRAVGLTSKEAAALVRVAKAHLSG